LGRAHYAEREAQNTEDGETALKIENLTITEGFRELVLLGVRQTGGRF
jgi:hypothetical protein